MKILTRREKEREGERERECDIVSGINDDKDKGM